MKEYPSLHIGRRLSAIDCKIVGGSRTEEEKGRPYKVPTGPPLARAEPETRTLTPSSHQDRARRPDDVSRRLA
jgi:hypothetical protein